MGKTGKGCDPSMNCRGGQSFFGLRPPRRGIFNHYGLLVCRIVGFEVMGRKSHNALAAVVFAGNCKSRIKGKCLAATRGSEPNQGTESRFDEQLHNDQEAAFTVCVDFEKAGIHTASRTWREEVGFDFPLLYLLLICFNNFECRCRRPHCIPPVLWCGLANTPSNTGGILFQTAQDIFCFSSRAG
jgi:hypothetical protein